MGRRTSSKIRVEGDVAYVELTLGQEAMIDVADVPLVEGRTWQATPNAMGGYYASAARRSGDPEKPKTIYMHRLIMGNPKGETIDHKHHCTLDNRRSELVVTSQWKNSQNRNGLDRRNRTGGRGVHEWTSSRGIAYYVARIGLVRYFPHTPEGLVQAQQAAEEMRAMLTITGDIEIKES